MATAIPTAHFYDKEDLRGLFNGWLIFIIYRVTFKLIFNHRSSSPTANCVIKSCLLKILSSLCILPSTLF